MIDAMAQAEVGDDVYKEDPTINRLEEIAADYLGKEAALFVTSGTQGNQVAVLTHCVNGDEVILEAESHLFYYEAGAMAALAGVQTRTLPGVRGAMQATDVEKAIRGVNIHYPRTKLICLENTHNRAGGAVLTPDQMKAVYDVASARHIPVHLDGARLYNAAVALGIDVRELTRYTDTVQVCLSKGLSAPVGSVLAGDRDFIEEARWWRKKLGGGMRQAGYLAAPGILALTEMTQRLQEDHDRAKQLEVGLQKLQIEVEPVETNIVLVNTHSLKLTAEQFISRLREKGVLANDFDQYVTRFTTHRHIEEQDITRVLEIMEGIVEETKALR
ncbi:aminotransferase class I/II-fold pyridoxal phosphate-dependent enzyme [Brevibacillus invocatus]|uniref:Aminotransferase class I/II-fold pyridoxal phosphate-dependent enzyme n=2 Tax=Brevibacillus TaxID=55080 RepID=A0A3M8CCG1_9BACL|nr:aminotransferase class I/II-fold pyridoxal phosphate-dependent enzyme [Brevibacillus invocatus]MCM3431746.1 aminotransferase class I/II-fold pyridoxal phosphate-dependent enzyme [Brevibacillus invocatus]MDH4618623.1 aminotransferase class I/II-fold pyridoxal phosphate-dependent enzyme [Brevibacillus sp. AY1]RNB73410.1 aminotransferase class I/II-fold pyridoxal phosphate-dependent enzyme [Brevibacillus invocatus]